MAEIIQGSDLMLFVGGKSIAFATNHTLSITAETTDTTHKDIKGGWSDSLVKSFSWEVTTENLFSNDGEGGTFDTLFASMTSKTQVDVVFGLNESNATTVTTGGWVAPTKGQYKGKARITSLQVNAPSGDNATFTATLQGCGVLEKVANS